MKVKHIVDLGLALVCLAALIIGFYPSAPSQKAHEQAKPSIVMESLDYRVLPYENLWQKEISRRFDNAVGVIVHGGDFVNNQWIVGTHWQYWAHVTPVEDIVAHFEKLYPDRTIVLVSCNPGRITLHGHPRVYYALDSVWVWPDRQMGNEPAENRYLTLKGECLYNPLSDSHPLRSDVAPNVVGSIFEFIQAD